MLFGMLFGFQFLFVKFVFSEYAIVKCIHIHHCDHTSFLLIDFVSVLDYLLASFIFSISLLADSLMNASI